MRLINSSVEILDQIDGEEVLKKLERIARTCYKSESRITEDGSSARKLLTNIIKSGHEAMIEHYSFSVKFICSRAISHELVRHRMASFAQESQRYVNYGKRGEIEFVIPANLENQISPEDNPMTIALKNPNHYSFAERFASNAWRSEEAYLAAIENGVKPQEARDLLINATKTEIVMTANLREWRHFFKLRCDQAAHPDMRELALDLLARVHSRIPVIFDDLFDKFIGGK